MTGFATSKDEALASNELDRVVGGIIVAGGLQNSVPSADKENHGISLNYQKIFVPHFEY